MSSGGGIARFASRKIDSTNSGTNSTATEIRNDTATTTPTANAFSFGATNDTDDALTTASEDEFGLMDGGNSFGGGDDFGFQGDGGFGEENYGAGTENQYCLTETAPNEDSTTNANQPASGLPFFRNHVAAPTVLQNKNVTQSYAFSEGATFACGTPASSAKPLKNDKTNDGVSTKGSVLYKPTNEAFPNVLASQVTPDGRVLPVPMLQLPTINNPSTLDEVCVHHFNNNDHEYPTPTDATTASKFAVMAPPPPKRPSTVTPTSAGNPASTFQFVREGTQLFQPQQLADSTGEKQFVSSFKNSESNNQELGDKNSNDENPVVIEGTDMPGPKDITFVDQYQHFTSTIQMLQDQDAQYHDILLEGTMKLNTATSMLLQLKCDMYDLTDNILEELDSIQEYTQDFLPVVESD